MRLIGRIDWAGRRLCRRHPLRPARPDVHGQRRAAGVPPAAGSAARSSGGWSSPRRAHGSDVLAAGVEEGDEDGRGFAARFGLCEVLRELEISRLVGPDEPEPTLPQGIVLVELAQRPDLLRDAYAVSL